MKERIVGRIVDGWYEVVGTSYRKPLDEARQDEKLRAAIKRNGWESIPNENG